MAFNPSQMLDALNPTKKPGALLLALNAAGMVFAAMSNTWAIASDKNTKPEDKKILVPAGAMTGAANIVAYYAITQKIIDSFEKGAVEAVGGTLEQKDKTTKEIIKKVIECPKNFDLEGHTKNFYLGVLEKAKNGIFFGLFGKKSKEEIETIADTFFENGKELLNSGAENIKDALKNAKPTKYAIETMQDNIKKGAGVLGAFTGAVIGCSLLTPIIRDIGAYIVQKRLEKEQPELKDKPYRPYFDPTHVGNNGRYFKLDKQPLSMKSYMTFTNSSSLKV